MDSFALSNTIKLGAISQPTEIDVVMISLGSRCFGLPLANVRHICPIPCTFVSYGDSVENYFVFQGEPLPYVSLWNAFRQQSAYAEFEELRTMLPQRRQDHIGLDELA